MKVIDLLNKIANGEEIPEYIRYFNKYSNEKMVMLVCKDNIIYRLNQGDIDLTDEIEIIEEDKKIEKIDLLTLVDVIELLGSSPKEYQKEALQNIFMHIRKQEEIINEIIDYLDYLKSKGESLDGN